ncbi:P-loop containing nucleoside triphosphate hydrolase protein [Geopyxis carbonaria]|nr:P-loop containing nucleoside triphosphate hydrolase protein [Geopyxis carbonaria]
MILLCVNADTLSGGLIKIAQFVQNIWIESYDPTIEDSYRKVVDVSGESVILEILDTAGTEQFNVQGFLLVYSITSLNSLGELPIIRDQILRIKEVEAVPMVLVGNKSDLEQDRQVSHNRANYVSRKWGGVSVHETSAKKRQNVDEVFLDLCKQMMKEYIGKEPTHRGEGRDRGRRRTGGRVCVIL